MNIDIFQKDISKHLNNESIGELIPGTTPRRYIPDVGVKKHNERIHRESKQVDTYGDLPFTFSKPKKSSVSTKLIKCSNCGNITHGHKNTVGIICQSCKKYSSVEEVLPYYGEEER